MNSKITALLAAAALCAVTAVSCGKDEISSSDVVLDINNSTTSSSETTTTAEKDEATTTTAVTTKDAKKTTTTTSGSKKPTTTTTAVADNDNDKSDDNDNQGGDDQSYDEPQPDEPQNNQPDPEPQQPQEGSFSNSDLNFNGTALLGNADGLISSLGNPNDVVEAPGCLSNGADQKIYYYSGIDVSCYVMNGSETVYDITISGAGYSTPKGISVGSSRSDVEAVYGKGDGGSSTVIYGSADFGLYIFYNGDTVSMIDYYASV
ncbi:MAG: hypothetical protein NC247_07940 [Ruminococcus flavefaciens]|nr:hypothetical protein [Ruminococcus flavefaciens]MCM1361243.1 hypothetical protein [Clostridiales bacterium]MCM1435731.1 hypothetical protein [Ruminococcus flavefaciens]